MIPVTFYVERTRTRDRRSELLLGGASQVGVVKYSTTFATEAGARIEARAWEETGDWSCRVVEGRAPAARHTRRL